MVVILCVHANICSFSVLRSLYMFGLGFNSVAHLIAFDAVARRWHTSAPNERVNENGAVNGFSFQMGDGKWKSF